MAQRNPTIDRQSQPTPEKDPVGGLLLRTGYSAVERDLHRLTGLTTIAAMMHEELFVAEEGARVITPTELLAKIALELEELANDPHQRGQRLSFARVAHSVSHLAMDSWAGQPEVTRLSAIDDLGHSASGACHAFDLAVGWASIHPLSSVRGILDEPLAVPQQRGPADTTASYSSPSHSA